MAEGHTGQGHTGQTWTTGKQVPVSVTQPPRPRAPVARDRRTAHTRAVSRVNRGGREERHARLAPRPVKRPVDGPRWRQGCLDAQGTAASAAFSSQSNQDIGGDGLWWDGWGRGPEGASPGAREASGWLRDRARWRSGAAGSQNGGRARAAIFGQGQQSARLAWRWSSRSGPLRCQDLALGKAVDARVASIRGREDGPDRASRPLIGHSHRAVSTEMQVPENAAPDLLQGALHRASRTSGSRPRRWGSGGTPWKCSRWSSP
jgi:hypothetical protein